jgi:molecular chaperone DnaK (HSP70)
LSPDDCSQLGRCSVRELPADLPNQTPIEVRFKYEENGRLTVNVQVEGTKKQLQHEIQRENSLTQEQLDSWRKYVCGLEAAVQAEPIGLPRPAAKADLAGKSVAAARADAMPVASDKTVAIKKPAAAGGTKPAPSAKSRDLASIAAEALEDDEEVVTPDAYGREAFIRVRYAEELKRFQGTANDARRAEELALQFVMREFSLKRQEVETILAEK